MSCPRCKCKETHYYSVDEFNDNETELLRCVNCGLIFDSFDSFEDDEEDD